MKESAGVLVAVEGRPIGALNFVVHVYLGSVACDVTFNVMLDFVRPADMLSINKAYRQHQLNSE